MSENKIKFEPKLSFDGVAIIFGVVSIAIWFGGLQQRLAQTEKQVAENTTVIQTLAKTTAQLATLIDERTTRGKP